MISELEQKIGFSFFNLSLLEQALTTSAYANENRVISYQRMEFLGDGILTFVMGEYLYLQFPEAEEGELTRMRANLVSGIRLEQVGRGLSLEKYAKIPPKIQSHSNYHIPYEDMVEAIIGALYLDQGYEAAKKFILTFILDLQTNLPFRKDSKSTVQELYHEKFHRNVISYHVLSEEGMDNDKIFTVEMRLNGSRMSIGKGKSIKKAEQNAAQSHLQEFQNGKK